MTQDREDNRFVPEGYVSARKHEALLKKYRALCDKYAALVSRYEHLVGDRVGVNRLASWALKLTTGAVAIVRHDAVVLANNRFEAWAGTAVNAPFWRVRNGPRVADVPAAAPFRALVIALGNYCDQGEKSHVWEVECDADGTTLEVRCERISTAGGRSLIALLALDVTERVRRQREIEEARAALAREDRLRSLGTLAAGVAHDLNTVFSTVSLRVSQLENEDLPEERRRESVRALRRVLDDAMTVVERLSRYGKTPAVPGASHVDLASVAVDAIEIADVAMRERRAGKPGNVRVETTLCEAPVVGTPAELRHALVNLLLNACDAMPRGGTIRVGILADGNRAVLTVRDEGSGIAPDHLGRVFDPFFSTKGAHGVGLGLSNAKRAVESAGGRISAANAPEGGAMFTVELPLAGAAPLGDEARASSASSGPTAPTAGRFRDGDP